MMKRPITPASTLILSVALSSNLILPQLTWGGNDRDGFSSGSSTSVERELARRQEYIRRGMSALEAGDKAMRNKDYEEAFKQYRLAADQIPDAPNTVRLRSHALHGLCDAACALAEQRIAEGRYGDAEATLRVVIADYDPKC